MFCFFYKFSNITIEDNMFTREDVTIAYKKLKSYVYYENFSLSLRIKIAEYEDDNIDDKLEKLYSNLKKFSKTKDFKIFDEDFRDIKCSLTIKSFDNYSEKGSNLNGFYYSNINRSKDYFIKRITPFIDCSVEIHIISILWIMFIGNELDEKLGTCCFGNRVHRNIDNDFEKNSVKLFKKYFLSYSEWRDQGVKKAKEIHNLGIDVAILNLDLKNYYTSIDLDVESIKTYEDKMWLNTLLSKIHKCYKKVLKSKTAFNSDKNILPIGLISSSILANYYLHDFDQYIVHDKKLAFYGRYVDDIVMVFTNPQIKGGQKIFDNFISYNLFDDEKYFSKEKDSDDYIIKIGGNNLVFQKEKVKLFYFKADEPINLLDEFEKEIKKNSSEFKFEPEYKDVLNGFEEASYKINYNDTINKLRSLDGISVDKLGTSKHLSKLINATKISEKLDGEILKKTVHQIDEYFSGKRALELNSFWEKVFTFYLINNCHSEIIKFSKEIIISINRLRYNKKNSEIQNGDQLLNVQTTLIEHLVNTFSMACSLNNDFFNEKIIGNIKDMNHKNGLNNLLKFLTHEQINFKAKALIKSNLFRHHLIYYPLINYCTQYKNFNFLSKNLNIQNIKFDFCDTKIKYSPRFVNYHELSLFYQFKNVFENCNYPEEVLYKNIFKDFIRVNTLNKFKKKYEKAFPTLSYFAKSRSTNEGLKIDIPSSIKVDNIRIGIVNIKIDPKNSLSSMKGRPNLAFSRFNELNHVLNESLHWQKCDIIIFPEISIPYQWLPHLATFSKKNDIAIICGLEHLSNKGKAVLNHVVTILPYSYNGYRNCLVDFRLKKDYSPSEIDSISGWKYKVPYKKMKREKLKLYKWRGTNFSVLNCFELTDIRKRAIFRGKLDYLVTIEHNHDINYFSNITESISRDIHSYIIQVNTSDYGDSRIVRPAETSKKDILKIKGGDNISLITDKIDIKSLRSFQSMEYNLQEKSKDFKYTPPNFVVDRD